MLPLSLLLGEEEEGVSCVGADWGAELLLEVLLVAELLGCVDMLLLGVLLGCWVERRPGEAKTTTEPEMPTIGAEGGKSWPGM